MKFLDALPEKAGKILTDRRDLKTTSLSENIQTILRNGDISAPKLFWEMARLCWGRKAIKPTEYFNYRVYRQDLTWEEKRGFVGEERNYKMNLKLSPPETIQMRGFLNDKFAFGALCQQMGLAFAETQAVYSLDRFTGTLPSLSSADHIVEFLTTKAQFPIFGKPINKMQALGSARIDQVDADTGTASLSNGDVASMREMAEEIVLTILMVTHSNLSLNSTAN